MAKLFSSSSSPSASSNSNNNTGDNVAQPISFIEYASRHGAQALLGRFRHRPGYFDEAFSDLHIEQINADAAICSLVIGKKLANSYGTLHGGAIASLVDIVGTLALLGYDKDKGGVTVELSATFCSAAKLGSKIEIVGRCLKKPGRSLGFTEVNLYTEQRALIASGRHTKAFSSK